MGYRGLVENTALKHDLGGFVYNDVDGSVRIICEGMEKAIDAFLRDVKKILPTASVEMEEKIYFPRPFGRVVLGFERDVFERLDLGVERLGSIDSRLESIDDKLGSINTAQHDTVSVLKEVRDILKEKE
jgi:acylphosphatase